MEIERLTISNFRGVSGTLEINPNGQNVVLVGPNGSGKSSVIAAIDFLLTGTIRELTGEGSGPLSEKRHGPHVDAKPSESWVEGEFNLDGETISIKRTLENRSEAVVTGGSEDVPAEFEAMEQAANRGLHILTRDQLLDFITSKAGTRSDRIRTLLDLQNLKPRRRALDNAAIHFENERDRYDREASSKRSELYDAVDVDPDQRNLQDQINELRDELGGKELDTISGGSFRKDLNSPTERVSESPLLRSRGNQYVQRLKTWFEDGADAFLEEDRSYRETWASIDADEDTVAALERLQLLERGREALDPEKERCPLCQTSWDPNELQELLDNRIERAHELDEALAELEPQRDSAQEKLTDIRVGAESLLESVTEVDDFDPEPLESFIETVEEWEDEYDGNLLETPPNYNLEAKERRSLVAPAALQSLLRELETYIEDQPDLDVLEQAWSDLEHAEERYAQMIAASRTAAEYKDAATEMRNVHGHFLEARDDILDEIYGEIEDHFETLYTRLHEDEGSFSINLTPTQRSLDLEVDFYDRGEYPPNALHSEGHQDSMGICLFFALCSWMNEQEDLSLLLLDDVVMSIDASHRRPIADIMGEELSGEFQMFVTTHDDLWHRHLRTAGVVSSDGAVQFTGWDIEDGPQILGSPEMEWDTILEHLHDGNTSIAAHQTRRMAEWYLREACHRLDGKVVFKANSNWNLGDFKSGVVSRYLELLRKSKQAEESWGRDTSDVAADEERMEDISQRLDKDGAALNPNVHWNETESEFAHCTPDELEPAIAAYRDLYEELWCGTCNSCLRLVKEGNRPAAMRCRCGDTNMNLRKK